MRLFKEMPAKYIVREVDHLKEKHKIYYGNYSKSDSLYAYVVGGSLFSEYVEKSEYKEQSSQDIPPLQEENGFPIIEISKEQCIEFYLNRMKEAGERFVFLEILVDDKSPWYLRHPLYYIPIDRLILESSIGHTSHASVMLKECSKG